MRRHPALLGLRRAARNLPLALLLWLTHLLLALVVVAPFASRLGERLDRAPVAAELLERPGLDLVVEVVRAEADLFASLRPLVVAVGLLALIANALLAGGVLEALLASDARPLAHRFGRGAGRFAGRMLRIGALALPAALLLAALTAMPWLALSRRLGGGDHEVASTWLYLGGLAAGGLVLVAVLLALDLARVQLVREDRSDTARLLLSSFGLVLRHPLRVIGTWAVMPVCFLALLGVYWLAAASIPAASIFGMALLVLLQQVVMIGRSALRIALSAAEIEIVGDLRPRSTASSTGGPGHEMP